MGCQSGGSDQKGAKLLLRSLVTCESVRPVQGSKSPKSGKEGFGVKKLPCPSAPEMGALSHFPCGALWRHGDFLTQSAHFRGTGKWEFFGHPLFPILAILTPVPGGRFRKSGVTKTRAIASGILPDSQLLEHSSFESVVRDAIASGILPDN